MTEPVGLCGVLTSTRRVLSRTAASTRSADCLNPSARSSLYLETLSPQARATAGMAGNEGNGKVIEAPGSEAMQYSADNASDAPVVMTTQSGSTSWNAATCRRSASLPCGGKLQLSLIHI